MKFVQKIIWIVATLVALVLEMSIRIVIFFPIGLLLTIVLSFCGVKYWCHNNRFLDYCCPWKLEVENFHFANATSNWFNPEF